jgi:hypothetical protein
MVLGNGIGVPFTHTVSGGGGGAFILDDYPAYAAFSLQKIKSDYSGSSIRVRRDSDNAEQDIGFTVANALDSSSLLTFVGAGDGFVTIAYNQMGGTNFTQTTANNQPKIVSSGSLITDPNNGLAAIEFDGSYSELRDGGLGTVVNLDSYRVGNTSDNKFIMLSGLTTKYSFVATSGNTNTNIMKNYGTPALYVNNVLKSVTTRDDVNDAIAIGTASVVNHFNATPNAWGSSVKVGAYWANGWHYDGLIQEFIFYNAHNTTADRSAITTLLMDKYVP